MSGVTSSCHLPIVWLCWHICLFWWYCLYFLSTCRFTLAAGWLRAVRTSSSLILGQLLGTWTVGRGICGTHAASGCPFTTGRPTTRSSLVLLWPGSSRRWRNPFCKLYTTNHLECLAGFLAVVFQSIQAGIWINSVYVNFSRFEADIGINLLMILNLSVSVCS